MDVSKLPRLSKTENSTGAAQSPAPADASPSASPPPQAIVEYRYLQPAPAEPSGAEIWFTGIIGLLLLAIGRNFGRYCWAAMRHQPFHTGFVWPEGTPLAGTEVAYPELDSLAFYSDSALFLFGTALLISAVCHIVMMKRAGRVRLAAAVSLGAVFLATGYNVFVSMKLLSADILPWMSVLCIAFGGYIAFVEWKVLRPKVIPPAGSLTISAMGEDIPKLQYEKPRAKQRQHWAGALLDLLLAVTAGFGLLTLIALVVMLAKGILPYPIAGLVMLAVIGTGAVCAVFYWLRSRGR